MRAGCSACAPVPSERCHAHVAIHHGASFAATAPAVQVVPSTGAIGVARPGCSARNRHARMERRETNNNSSSTRHMYGCTVFALPFVVASRCTVVDAIETWFSGECRSRDHKLKGAHCVARGYKMLSHKKGLDLDAATGLIDLLYSHARPRARRAAVWSRRRDARRPSCSQHAPSSTRYRATLSRREPTRAALPS